jgi:competence protein ComEC
VKAPPAAGVSGPVAELSARWPAILPAAGILAGAALAARLSWLPVPLLVLLAAAGLALRGSAGGLVAGLAAGLVAATVQLALPGEPWSRLDPDRPVAVTGRVVAYGERSEWGWRTALRAERLAQGRWVSAFGRDLVLELPEGERPPPLGSRLTARGYVARSPGYANRAPLPPGPWRLRVKSRLLLTVEAAPGALARGAAAVHVAVERGWEGAAARAAGGTRRPGAGLALVRALVLGDPSFLPSAWRRGLRRTGLSHLLAVSGLHVGLVAGLALLAAGALGPRGRVLAALGVVALYLLVAGPRPALLRASFMALAAGVAFLVGRLPSAGNALAVAAALLVLRRPELLSDLGFELTVAATAGLIFLAPACARAWGGGEGRRGLRAGLVRALAASLAAQLAALPLALPAFHLLAPASPLLNLLAVPWTAVTLAVGLAWSALAMVSPIAGAATVPLLDALAAPFGWPARGSPQAWGTLALAAPAGLCLLAATAGALLLAWPRRREAWLGVLALAALVATIGRGSGTPPAFRAEAALTLLDVGQGDSLLLTDGRRALLVDGGGWRHGDFGGRVLLPALLAEGVARLDVAVLTHPDVDHCGGLVDLASYLPIDEVWMAPGEEAEPCAAALAAAPGPRLRHLAAGDLRSVGTWRFAVLNPRREGAGGGSDNDGSLVLAASALGRRALLTGDVEARGEGAMVGRLEAAAGGGRFDVLKVAHHGSRTSSTPPLLAAVRPRLALVSVGLGNPYGHPAPDVVARLRRAGARVLRTDRVGEVRLAWEPDGPIHIEVPAYPR